MRITYDSEVDALYIRFIEATVRSEHVAPGIAVDYDAEGKIAGIEILDAIKRFGNKDVMNYPAAELRGTRGKKHRLSRTRDFTPEQSSEECL